MVRNRIKRLIVLFVVVMALAACGSGNGGDDSPAVRPVAPSISVSASSATAVINSEFTLTWSTTNADTCFASGDWSGDKATSGSEAITEVQIGTKGYSISCSGAGGQASASVEVEITARSNTDQWDHYQVPYGTDDPNRHDDYSAGHSVDLKEVAKSISEKYAYYYN